MKCSPVSWLVIGFAVCLGVGQQVRGDETGKSQKVAVGDVEVRLKLAESLLYSRQYDEALEEYKRILDADPNQREARIGCAKAYFWSGRSEKAAEVLEPLSGDSADAEVRQLWGEIIGASGDTAEALKAMEASIEANPDDMDMSRGYANRLVGSGCYATGIRVLERLSEAHPASGDIALDLAQAYFVADRYPEAIHVCTQRATGGADVGERARLLLARCLLKSWLMDEAVEVLENIRATDSDEPRACLGLLTVWILDPESSELDVDSCVEELSRPLNQRRMKKLAAIREWLYTLVGEWVSHEATDERKAAAQRFVEMLGDNDAASIRLCREVFAQYIEDGPDAVDPDVEWLIEEIESGTAPRPAVSEACSLLLSLGAGDKLAEVAQAALTQWPEDTYLKLLRAEGLSIIPAYDDAEEAYEEILEDLPRCTKARRGLARTYSWRRRFDEGERIYEDLVERDPRDMAMRREAARSLGWDKRLVDSLDAYDEAAEMLSSNGPEGVWKDRLEKERKAKHSHWWTRNYQAVEQYDELLEDQPSDLECLFDLGQVYAQCRHWEEAADQYHKILAIDARHRRARDALYKNGVYHHPEVTVSFSLTEESGRGNLVDIKTQKLTEVLKQEIARRTDLSLITTQMWHKFDYFGGGRLREHDARLRLDHRFNLKTWGHVSWGWVWMSQTHDPGRWIGDAALTYEFTDWLAGTVGGKREPWRRNRATIVQGIDETRVFGGLYGDICPWFDAWVEYGHSWLEGGHINLERNRRSEDRTDAVYTDKNEYDELLWGAEMRFTLFPKILKLEYRGFAWWFDKEVPTYFSPDSFMNHTFRLAWRHYLNTDQYFEQKKLYYEVGLSSSWDSDGEQGCGYDVEVGWDVCHHFGVMAKWSGFDSRVYDADIFFIQMVMRF